MQMICEKMLMLKHEKFLKHGAVIINMVED